MPELKEIVEKAKAGELTFGDVKQLLREVASYYDEYDDETKVGPLMDLSSYLGWKVADIQTLINQSGRIGLILPTETN